MGRAGGGGTHVLDAPPFFFFFPFSRVYGKVESRIHVLMQKSSINKCLIYYRREGAGGNIHVYITRLCLGGDAHQKGGGGTDG